MKQTFLRSGVVLRSIAAVAMMAAMPLGVAQTAATTARVNDRAVTDRYLTTVQVELNGKVDTRTAKPGQEISARVSDNATLADGTRLARGARLVGRVLAVQAPTEQSPGALLAIAFDHAEVKGSQPVAVRVVVEMVGSPGAAAAPMMRGGGDMAEPMGGMERPGSSIGGPIGAQTGGPLSTAASGIARPGSVRQPGVAGIPTGASGTGGGPALDPIGGAGSISDPLGGQTAGQINGPLGTVAGAGSAPVADRPVVSAGENVSGMARHTALPGVMLNQAASGDVSGLLTAAGRNITLESGTRLTLGVIAR